MITFPSTTLNNALVVADCLPSSPDGDFVGAAACGTIAEGSIGGGKSTVKSSFSGFYFQLHPNINLFSTDRHLIINRGYSIVVVEFLNYTFKLYLLLLYQKCEMESYRPKQTMVVWNIRNVNAS